MKPIYLMLIFPVFLFLSSQLLSAEVLSNPGSNIVQSQRIPLVFEANQGQAGSDVRFLSRGLGYNILISRNKAEFVLPISMTGSAYDGRLPYSNVEITFPHSSPFSTLQPLDLLPGKSNYFIGKDSSKWIVGASQYRRVSLRSLYPGIDLVYYGNAGQLEYDFVVSPGADPKRIKFHVSGSDRVFIDGDGNLHMEIAGRTIEFQKPFVYQETGGTKHRVFGEFVMLGTGDVSFAVGPYNKRTSLVIDPSLSYSTLIGANNNTQAQGVAVDHSGNVYIAGTTFATNYPTVKAFQITNNGTTNVFITKLNPAGDVILYSTYLGGGGFDTGRAIAVDKSGSAYVTGNTDGAFPTTPGAFMSTCTGACNTPFITKILTDGSLAYSTLMGGSNVAGWAIAVDSAGEAYITGTAASNDLPTTSGSFESVFPGSQCTSCNAAYIEKLNSTGSGLVYSTYFGGVGYGGVPATSGSGIAVDDTGSAYLVGNTTAIPTQNPIQSSYVGENLPNAFISKFSADGSSLVFSTYLGGSSPFFFSYAGDFATGVAVDSSGNVHVVGTSSSCDFPLNLNAFSTECPTTGYTQQVFVVTLNSAGNGLLFSTFLQSGFSEGIAVDSAGNTYVTGIDTSNNLPILNPIESTSQDASSPSGVNGFVTELDLSGNLQFSTYLGQTGGGAEPAGIAIDAKSNIYVTGAAQGDFPILNPIPKETFQTTYYTFFVSKISAENTSRFSLSPRVSPILALRNVSSVPLTIESITASSNFTQGGTCGSSLAPGTGCTLILEGAADHKTTGTVTIVSNAYSKPQKFVIQKSPTGDQVGSILSIFPLSLQFPAQLIGTTSATQQIVLTNSGLLPATINSIEPIQPLAFSETNNCPGSLDPGSSCTISVTYTAATAQDSGQIAIIADPDQTRYTAFLGGTGSTSALSASVSSVNFGTQYVGATPLGRMVNITNTTPYPAAVTGVSTSAEFAQQNTCTAPLAPYASCRISVSYSPLTNEITTGTLTAAGSGPGGSQTISLNGNGLIVSNLAVYPIPLDLYSDVDGFAGSGVITVTNTSSTSAKITSIAIPSPFSQTNNCLGTLNSSASCSVTVTFAPTQLGAINANLSIANSGPNSPQIVPVIGTAQVLFNFSQLLFTFGPEKLHTGYMGYAGLTNYSSKSITVNNVTVQGQDFALTKNGCQVVFGPNEGCEDIEVTFTPSATGVRTGTITVSDSDPSSPHTATLQGIGISDGQGTVSQTSLSFGSRAVGTQSLPQVVTLTNTGTGVLTLSGITVSSQFSQTNTCGSKLKKGASCTISTIFAPSLQGILDGTLTIQDDGAGSPHVVALSGIGQ
jgi:hypothetical protein